MLPVHQFIIYKISQYTLQLSHASQQVILEIYATKPNIWPPSQLTCED